MNQPAAWPPIPWGRWNWLINAFAVFCFAPPGRVSGQRRYAPDAVGVVGAVLLLADVGFTLAEIEQLMAARAHDPSRWRELARRKLTELDERIAEAKAARVAVEHALACPHEDIVTCPNFQEVVRLRLAGKPLEEVHAARP